MQGRWKQQGLCQRVRCRGDYNTILALINIVNILTFCQLGVMLKQECYLIILAPVESS